MRVLSRKSRELSRLPIEEWLRCMPRRLRRPIKLSRLSMPPLKRDMQPRRLLERRNSTPFSKSDQSMHPMLLLELIYFLAI